MPLKMQDGLPEIVHKQKKQLSYGNGRTVF